jgi:hypothetical protein
MRLGIGKKKGNAKPAAGGKAAKPRKEKKNKEKKPKAKARKPKEKKPKPLSSGRGIAVARPQMNLDTALLGVAALALTCGCLLLLMEIYRFGGFGAITGPI